MRFDTLGYLYSSNRYSQRITTTLQRLFGAHIKLEFRFYKMVQDIFVAAYLNMLSFKKYTICSNEEKDVCNYQVFVRNENEDNEEPTTGNSRLFSSDPIFYEGQLQRKINYAVRDLLAISRTA